MAARAMHETKIDISEGARRELVQLLNERLADTLDLYTQTKHAHWNVKGSDFIQLHELYDTLAGHALEWIDLLAERATTLGGVARGTLRMAAEASGLDEYPAAAFEGMETVRALVDRFARYAGEIRRAAEEAEKLGDMTTNDLFLEVSAQADKDLWFLEAHLQGKPSRK
ncbi:MAG TPA: DNA starvation/stationary phase protection protein Dps [Actinomycetota bacterium]|nr:DNA starvation/stationary phase protection protein Dps [Actinomycetota bacterium]